MKDSLFLEAGIDEECARIEDLINISKQSGSADEASSSSGNTTLIHRSWYRDHMTENKLDSDTETLALFSDSPRNEASHLETTATYQSSSRGVDLSTNLFKSRNSGYAGHDPIQDEGYPTNNSLLPSGVEETRSTPPDGPVPLDGTWPSVRARTTSLVSDSETPEEAPSSSPTSLLDSDMVSIPDSEDDFTSFDFSSDEQSMRIVSAVSRRLYREVSLKSNSGEQATSDEETPISQRTDSSQKSRSDTAGSTERPSRKSKKRKSGDKNDGEEDEDEAGDRRGCPKRAVLEQRDGLRRLLACPFWKRDAIRHRDCFKLKLDGIARVKQHLSRSHYDESHCERCKAVFASSASLEDHLRYEQCQWRGSDALEGISHQQRNDLSKKSKPHHSESDRWFAIWEVIFPGLPAPSSAYMDPNLSQDLSEFRLYAQTHGTRILLEVLEQEGLSDSLQAVEGSQNLLRAALSRGQDLIFDEWLANGTSSSGTSSSSIRPASSNDNRESDTSRQSVADSGVVLGSQEEPGIRPDHLEMNDGPIFVGSDQFGLDGTTALDTSSGPIVAQAEHLSILGGSTLFGELESQNQPWSYDLKDLVGFDESSDIWGFLTA
ncbi:hypothetical protein PG984_009064 [Apiospora sp. TS-2023a]